jgi:hypothetical protein
LRPLNKAGIALTLFCLFTGRAEVTGAAFAVLVPFSEFKHDYGLLSSSSSARHLSSFSILYPYLRTIYGLKGIESTIDRHNSFSVQRNQA